jgi:hypothetical protein
VLFVEDPTVLSALEEGGASLAAMLNGTTEGPVDNGALAKGARYASVVQVLDGDLDEIARADPNAGVSVARSSHRLFDKRWLRSPSARFELVGLVNRLDRAGIVGGCGEVRLVYRLAYAASVNRERIASRLPMTVSLELLVRGDAAGRDPVNGAPSQPGEGSACRRAAQRWFPPPASREGAELARWVLSEQGPLLASQRAPQSIRRMAVNVQSVRWPSTVRPDLGGHAEYVLRAFSDDGTGRLAPAPLENTLDTARVRRETPLFQKLLAWVSSTSHLPDIDGATIVLPDELCAKRVVSVTPRGFARRKNRPFSTILRPLDVAALPLTTTRHAKSPAALLRRLDDLTCSGCHESRSVAGFHFLGVDREGPRRPTRSPHRFRPISSAIKSAVAKFWPRFAKGAPPLSRVLSPNAPPAETAVTARIAASAILVSQTGYVIRATAALRSTPRTVTGRWVFASPRPRGGRVIRARWGPWHRMPTPCAIASRACARRRVPMAQLATPTPSGFPVACARHPAAPFPPRRRAERSPSSMRSMPASHKTRASRPASPRTLRPPVYGAAVAKSHAATIIFAQGAASAFRLTSSFKCASTVIPCRPRAERREVGRA